MWPWLLKKWPSSVYVWARLIAFSTSFHAAILFIIFFMYKGDSGALNFEINKNLLNSDAPVVFMPLHKRIKQADQKKKGTVKKEAKAQTLKQEEALKENKKEQMAAKAEQSTTIVSSRPAKKKTEAKKESKQDIQKQQAESIKEKKLKEEIEAKVKKEDEVKKLDAIGQNIDVEDVRLVGREDLDALRMQEFVGAEVGQHWNPPIGIPQDAACEIKLIVDWKGKLKDIKMVKASNVAVYDISARNAVKKMSFPKWLWGKEFSITFKQ